VLKNSLYVTGSFLTVFATIIFLSYQQIFTNTYESDTQQHLQFVYDYLDNHEILSYPLWHLSTLYLAKLFHISIPYGAVLSSAFFVTLWYTVIFFYTQHTLKNFSANIHIAIAWIVFLIGPLCIPWYQHIIFWGQGSPNIWHNVTLWTVKPFALLSVWLSLEGLNKNDHKLLLWGGIFLFVSIVAKPSFIIVFLPALTLFASVKSLFKNRQFLIFFTLISIGSILLLIYQYIQTFTQDEGRIIIDYLGVWSLSSPNIPISIILALAFPLAFTLLQLDILKDDYILIGWIMVFISIFYYATFAQSGRFYSHGNFGWSYMIAMSLLYLFSIVKFFTRYSSLHIIKRFSLTALLAIQTLIGIFYFIQILMGKNPLFIGIFI